MDDVKESEFRLMTVKELSAMQVSTREEIITALETAVRILKQFPSGSHDDSAAWRLADAGLQLRELMDETGVIDVVGWDVPTARGALLPGGGCDGQRLDS